MTWTGRLLVVVKLTGPLGSKLVGLSSKEVQVVFLKTDSA